jgi:hypothetical protein
MRTRIVCTALASGRRPGAPAAINQRAGRQLEFGPEIVQMPLQRAVQADALTNEPFAVIDQQPQIELGPIHWATGNDARHSRNATRATPMPSIGSDFPRSRALLRAPADTCVGIRNTRSPRPTRNRSTTGLPPVSWTSDGWAIWPGGEDVCRCQRRRRIRRSSALRRSGCCVPVAGRSRSWRVSWAARSSRCVIGRVRSTSTRVTRRV